MLRQSSPRLSEDCCRKASCILSAADAAFRKSLHHSLQQTQAVRQCVVDIPTPMSVMAGAQGEMRHHG